MNTEDKNKDKIVVKCDVMVTSGLVSNIMVLISSTYTFLSHMDQFLHSCRLGIVSVACKCIYSVINYEYLKIFFGVMFVFMTVRCQFILLRTVFNIILVL